MSNSGSPQSVHDEIEKEPQTEGKNRLFLLMLYNFPTQPLSILNSDFYLFSDFHKT